MPEARAVLNNNNKPPPELVTGGDGPIRRRNSRAWDTQPISDLNTKTNMAAPTIMAAKEGDRPGTDEKGILDHPPGCQTVNKEVHDPQYFSIDFEALAQVFEDNLAPPRMDLHPAALAAHRETEWPSPTDGAMPDKLYDIYNQVRAYGIPNCAKLQLPS